MGSHFARAVRGTLVLRVASLGLVFASHLLLSRMLGVRGYGVYAFALAWLNALAVVATLGCERLVVREVAAHHARSSWEEWRGLLAWAERSVAAVALALAAGAAALFWMVAGGSEALGAFCVAMLLLPPLALARLRQYSLQGMHLPVVAQLPEGVLQPLLLIALLAGWHAAPGRLTAAGAMALSWAALCAAFACATVLFRRALPAQVREARPREQGALWRRSAAPLLLVSAAHAASGQIPVLMLGGLGSAEMAGILAAARRLADLTTLPSIAAGLVLAPTLARLWATGDTRGFQRTLTTFARGVTVLSLPLALVLIAFPRPLLALFGGSFAQGSTALVLLCLGQIANMAAGAVNQALVVTGHEHEAAGIAIATALLNLLLCALLIPRWGVEGAAGAASASLVVWNVWLAVRVRRRLGVWPTLLAPLPEPHAAR